MKNRVFLVVVSLLVGFAFGCKARKPALAADPLRQAYDSEADWSDPQRIIPLNYDQAQGKRIFYTQCVWCHADATPAGPSNRSNLNPMPALMNDGTVMNKESDEYLQNIVTLGGTALSRSAMMPPYGQVLTQHQIQQVVAYARAIAQPPYQPPRRVRGRNIPQGDLNEDQKSVAVLRAVVREFAAGEWHKPQRPG